MPSTNPGTGKGTTKGKAKSKRTKPKTKKTEFLGLTRADKAKSLGVSEDQYSARVTINNFRQTQARQYLKDHAKGVKNPEERKKVMQDAWKNSNKLAREKYGATIKKIGLNPTTFKF